MLQVPELTVIMLPRHDWSHLVNDSPSSLISHPRHLTTQCHNCSGGYTQDFAKISDRNTVVGGVLVNTTDPHSGILEYLTNQQLRY